MEPFNVSLVAPSNGSMDIESIFGHSETPEYIRKEFPLIFSGFDYEGKPVWILPFGTWDIKRVLNEKEENANLINTYSTECFQKVSHSIKLRNATQWVLIVDFDQYDYSQLTSYSTISLLMQMAKKFSGLFDTLAYGYSINMDYISRSLASIIKPLLGSLADRIDLYGFDATKYFPPILNKIPPTQLPSKYGGVKGHKPIVILN